jgi:type I restriction enzyme S subunit
MTEWRKRSITELCTHVVDCVNKTAPSSDSPSPYMMLRTPNIRNGWVDTSSVRYVTKSTFERWTRRMRPQRGDIILTREAPLGEVGVLRTDEAVFLGQRLVMYRPNESECDPRFLMYSMLGPTVQAELRSLGSGATVEHLRVPDCERLTIPCPPLSTQRSIGAVLESFDDLIDNNRQRISLLEELVGRMYHEWFVHFRFPGSDDARLVHSPLGPIPAGWEVRTIASIASDQRHAISSGPFGSKLGRRDYREEGVPVIRGVNLRVGGGFNESVLVFVTDEKAEELRPSWARRGDIVITQRGTLGQVGLIHSRSRFDQYVLSQSQMKVTTDAEIAEAVFFYAQMCSAPTAQRFIAQAMTSGVPHVNLGLLRDFRILLPPLALQQRYATIAEPSQKLASLLAEETSRLLAIRGFLLPKLVTGQIDVSGVDLGAVIEGAVA